MSARRTVVVAFAFAAMIAACFYDLSGFSSGAVADDAALAPDVFATVDAADADDVDGAVAVDAHTTFCAAAGAHTLCDDFDTTADAGWTRFEQSGGGTGAQDI